MAKTIGSLHEANKVIAEELKTIKHSMSKIRELAENFQISVLVDLGDNENHYIGGWDSSDYYWSSSDDNC